MIPLDVSPSHSLCDTPLESPSIILIPEGAPVYAFSDPTTGHKYWDLCDCDECYYDSIRDENHSRRPKKKKSRSSCSTFKRRYDQGDPHVGPLGQPSGKYDYLVSYGAPPPLLLSHQIRPVGILMMMTDDLNPYYRKALRCLPATKGNLNLSLQLLHVQCIQAALVQPLLQLHHQKIFPHLLLLQQKMLLMLGKSRIPTTERSHLLPRKLSLPAELPNLAISKCHCVILVSKNRISIVYSLHSRDNLAKLRAHIFFIMKYSRFQNRKIFLNKNKKSNFLRTQLDSLEQSQQPVRPRHDSTLSPLWTRSAQGHSSLFHSPRVTQPLQYPTFPHGLSQYVSLSAMHLPNKPGPHGPLNHPMYLPHQHIIPLHHQRLLETLQINLDLLLLPPPPPPISP
ncbi:hypothetical protein Patl1_15629 [Pistacia atlantica]|uniref:Uncharacterized protein n=1 Tax=Pistacia atlantica TaxID=434234 RepID=A0ACC1BAR9_9ROSI|nr:hypothetical protein Patl1_15629 [Pistacia atlantica]